MRIICPPPAAIASVDVQTCPVDFDQVIMAIFQRNNGDTILFTPTTVLLEATWTPMLSAADDTKVVATPKFAEFTFPQSAELSQGGNDNTTVGGIPYYTGEGNVSCTGNIPSLASAIKKELKSLTQESIVNQLGKTGLTVFFVNRYGQLIANLNATADVRGFPCYNVRFSSVGSEGYNSRNKTQMGILLPDGWDDNAVVYTPSFDILSAIVNA